MEGEWANGLLDGKGIVKYYDLATDQWTIHF
jgi:hypothetical protein